MGSLHHQGVDLDMPPGRVPDDVATRVHFGFVEGCGDETDRLPALVRDANPPAVQLLFGDELPDDRQTKLGIFGIGRKEDSTVEIRIELTHILPSTSQTFSISRDRLSDNDHLLHAAKRSLLTLRLVDPRHIEGSRAAQINAS